MVNSVVLVSTALAFGAVPHDVLRNQSKETNFMRISDGRSLMIPNMFGAAALGLCLVVAGCSPSGGNGGGGGQGSGGDSNGNGGNGNGNGGNGSGNGGNANGSGGNANGSGGKANGSGGKADGSGGNGSGGNGSGGNGNGSGGSANGSGGSGGGSSGPVTCTTDLMTLRAGDSNNWIATAPATCGVQGALYAFSDPTTCPSTANVCAAGSAGCCITGTTIVDSTYAAYGCGLGLDLNSSGGTSAVKSAYSGPAKGFKITLSGSVSKGQPIRIMYSSAATDPSGGTSPYKEVTDVGTYSVLFSDATCPTWATSAQCTPVSGSGAYSIKVQVAGGGASTDPVGPFNVCITSLTPL